MDQSKAVWHFVICAADHLLIFSSNFALIDLNFDSDLQIHLKLQTFIHWDLQILDLTALLKTIIKPI